MQRGGGEQRLQFSVRGTDLANLGFGAGAFYGRSAPGYVETYFSDWCVTVSRISLRDARALIPSVRRTES